MSEIREILSEILDGAQTVAIIGCGSLLMGDDAAGSLIARRLSLLSGSAAAFCCETAPENFTGDIKRLKPDVLLAIDAADMGLAPGAAALIPVGDIGGASFNTHMLPLRLMLEYLRLETGCRVYLLGIQGKKMAYSEHVTPEVGETVDEIADTLEKLLGNL